MKILCYGDSNTYGFIPGDGGRYDDNTRWTGRLQKLLGSDHMVIEEGLNARTTVYDDLFEEGKNGMTSLVPTLARYACPDIVLVFLGSNDLKGYFRASALTIAQNAGCIVDALRLYYKEKYGVEEQKVILVSPPEITRAFPGSNLPEEFWAMTIAKSKELHVHYEEIAKAKNCLFVDAAAVARPSDKDGLHFDEAAHKAFAEKIYEIVCAIDADISF